MRRFVVGASYSVSAFVEDVGGWASLLAWTGRGEEIDPDLALAAADKALSTPEGRAAVPCAELEPVLAAGLAHEDAGARGFAIRQAAKASPDAWAVDGDVFRAVLGAVSDEDAGVAAQASAFLLGVAEREPDAVLRAAAEAAEGARAAGRRGSTALLRLLALGLGAAARRSEDEAPPAAAAAMLSELVGMASPAGAERDLLASVAASEELAAAAAASPALLAAQLEAGVVEAVLAPHPLSAVHLFEALVRADKSGLVWLRDGPGARVLQAVCEAATAEAGSPAALSAALAVAAAPGGVDALAALPPSRLAAALGRAVSGTDDLLRSAALHGLAAVLRPPGGGGGGSAFQREAFEAVGAPALLRLLNQPFESTRLLALAAVECAARHRWGLAAVASCAGLLERLLDRRATQTKQGAEAQHAAVAAAARNPAAADPSVLSPHHARLLEQYARQGAFYARSEVRDPQVAVADVE